MLGEGIIKGMAETARNFVGSYVNDERLTTVAAQRALLEGDVSRAKRKEVIDQVAAVLILQGYLQSQAKEDDE